MRDHTFRRIVTGRTEDGGAEVLADEQLRLDQYGIRRVWGSEGPPSLTSDGVIPDLPGWFPPPGGCRVTIFTVPPDGAAGGQGRPDGPAPWGHDDVHASDTVDVIYLTSGSAWIQHPDGTEVRLDAGDVIVQHGTMHAWANHTDQWASGIAFVVGARSER